MFILYIYYRFDDYFNRRLCDLTVCLKQVGYFSTLFRYSNGDIPVILRKKRHM